MRRNLFRWIATLGVLLGLSSPAALPRGEAKESVATIAQRNVVTRIGPYYDKHAAERVVEDLRNNGYPPPTYSVYLEFESTPNRRAWFVVVERVR